MTSLNLTRTDEADDLDALLERDLDRSFKMAQALAPALDAIMASRSQPGYHRHICPCGDWYLCHQPADTCDPSYTCPSCLERQMDEYWSGGAR